MIKRFLGLSGYEIHKAYDFKIIEGRNRTIEGGHHSQGEKLAFDGARKNKVLTNKPSQRRYSSKREKEKSQTKSKEG